MDPLEYIEKYKDRIILIHQKDFPENARQTLDMFDGVVRRDGNLTHEVFSATKFPSCFTEVGTGVLPIQRYIDALSDAPNLEYLILEQDFTSCPTELESIKQSMAAFKKFEGHPTNLTAFFIVLNIIPPNFSSFVWRDDYSPAKHLGMGGTMW